MKTNPFFLLIFCLYLFGLGCAKFTELPLPEYEPHLVINCLFSPDSTWKVNVSQNTSIDDTSFLPTYITQAVVELWEEEVSLGQLQYSENGNYVLDKFPTVGKVYRLEVSAAGFPDVWTEDYIPEIPQDFETDWQLDNPISVIDQLGSVFESYPLDLTFSDISNQDNFYKVTMAMRDSCDCSHVNPPFVKYYDEELIDMWVGTQDPIVPTVSKNHYVILFEDLSFANQKKKLELYQDTTDFIYDYIWKKDDIEHDSVRWKFGGRGFNPGEAPRKDKIDIYIDFWSINQSLYDFYLTYLTQAYNTADPFATHINVASNIHGGRGIFAGYQRELILVYSH